MDVYCLSQLAGALLYQEKFDEALSAIQKADTLNSKFPLVPYYKGKTLVIKYFKRKTREFFFKGYELNFRKCIINIYEKVFCLKQASPKAANIHNRGLNSRRL